MWYTTTPQWKCRVATGTQIKFAKASFSEYHKGHAVTVQPPCRHTCRCQWQTNYTLGAQCCLHTILSPETSFSHIEKQSEDKCHQFLKLWAISCSNDQHQHGYLLDVAYLSILIYIFSCKSNICSSCMAGFSLDLFFISLMILYLAGKKETDNPGEFSLVHRCCTIKNNQWHAHVVTKGLSKFPLPPSCTSQICHLKIQKQN